MCRWRTMKQPSWQQITDQRTKKNRDLDLARAMGRDCTRVGGSTDALSSGARGKQRGFSPAAAAYPLDRTRARKEFWKKSEFFFLQLFFQLCNETQSLHCNLLMTSTLMWRIRCVAAGVRVLIHVLHVENKYTTYPGLGVLRKAGIDNDVWNLIFNLFILPLVHTFG